MSPSLLIASTSWALSAFIIMLFCKYFKKNLGKPNLILGYKTPRSLASQENWEVLNRAFVTKFSKSTLYLFLSAIALFGLSFTNITSQAVIISLSLCPILIIIAPVLQTFLQEESILKQHFNA